MFQDLPPVKGSVDPEAVPMSDWRDTTSGSEELKVQFDVQAVKARAKQPGWISRVGAPRSPSLVLAPGVGHAQLSRPRRRSRRSSSATASAPARRSAPRCRSAFRELARPIEQATRSDLIPTVLQRRRRPPASPSRRSCIRSRRRFSSWRSDARRLPSGSSPIGVVAEDRRRHCIRRPQRAGALPLPGMRRHHLLRAVDGGLRQWSLNVVAANDTGRPGPVMREVFDSIAFGHGEAPAAESACGGRHRSRAAGAAAGDDGSRRARPLQRPRRHRWLPGTRRLSAVHPQRGSRRQGTRAVRRPRTAGDPADCLPGRPGAEPHAMRAADDSRSIWRSSAPAPRPDRGGAVSCSARFTARRWRSSTASSA